MYTTNTYSLNNDSTVVLFFNAIMKNFATESIHFYEEWGEYPFIYKERQVNSALIPAIHKYTKNIFLELPFKNKSNKQRFLDIVTTKDDNIYLIELKHSFNSKLDGTTRRTDNEWETAVQQISDITKNTIKNHYNYKKYNVYKISLMIMPTYIPSNEKHNILDMSSKQYSKMLFNDYQKNYSKKYQANIVGSIKITDINNFIHKYKNSKEVYPFISFIGKVKKL